MSDKWEDRYISVKGNKEELMKRLEEDSKLLAALGGYPASFGPGITINIPGGGYLEANTVAWNWLHALLVDLLEYRVALLESDSLVDRMRDLPKEEWREVVTESAQPKKEEENS